MAKQRNIGTGVVAAAREVSAIQGRFQDFGGQFMAGFEKSMESKRKKEAEAKDILDRSNAYMNQFKNDIDVVKFKPEDQKIVKNTIARWRNEYADAASAAARIQDKTSPEYQQYIDIMNGVQNRMSNLKTNIDNLALHKAEHYSNVNDDLYSSTGTNQSSLLQAQVMVEMPIGNIDDNGDLLWGEGDNQFSFQNFSKPLEKASAQVASVGSLMAKSGRMKGPITEGDRIAIEGQIDDIFKGNRAIESIMADNEFKTLNFKDLDPSNPDDRKAAIQRLKNSVISNWGKGLTVTERSAMNGTSTTTSTGKKDRMPEYVEKLDALYATPGVPKVIGGVKVYYDPDVDTVDPEGPRVQKGGYVYKGGGQTVVLSYDEMIDFLNS